MEEIAQICSASRGLPDLGLSFAEPEEIGHHGGLNNNKRFNEEGDQNEGCIIPCNRKMSSTDSHTPQKVGQTHNHNNFIQIAYFKSVCLVGIISQCAL